MATYSVVDGTGASYPGISANGLPYVDAKIDFSKINDGAGTVQNDIVQLINVPAGTRVLYVASKNESVCESSGGTDLTDFDIGDGSDTDGYLDGISAATAGTYSCSGLALTEGTPNTITGYSNGKLYTAADTIDYKQNTNATIVTGILKVRAFLLPLANM